MTDRQQKQSRMREIKMKLDVLKGRAGIAERYRRNRDADKGDADSRDADGREANEAEEDPDDVLGSGTARKLSEDEMGMADERWAFERDDTAGGRAAARGRTLTGTPAEQALAVANVELNGTGGSASARQLLDAAETLAMAREHAKAAALLEIARTRIDKEQLERKIDALTAASLDDECLWQLAAAYRDCEKLTLSLDIYGRLKERSVGSKRSKAVREWAQVGFQLGVELYKVSRFNDALQVLRLVEDETTQAMVGDKLYDEVELNIAFTLQSLGRTGEALEILSKVAQGTASRKRRAQARFAIDVMSVDTSGERNEEFHQIWEDNFSLPSDSAAQVRYNSARSVGLNLTESERRWKTWTAEYWGERLKSPAYYLFLTLFVTWPFAIPVTAILSKQA